MSTKDHNRLAALAFCRADLLFEMDDRWRIEFCAGATPALLGRPPDGLLGSNFLELIAERDRALTEQLLILSGAEGRIDDVIVSLNGSGPVSTVVAVSGYRVPDFNNHYFLALKVEPAHADYTAEEDLVHDEETALLDEQSYSKTAAERVLALQRAGGNARISLIKVDNLEGLLEKLGSSEKKDLLSSIGGILNAHSLGGNTASRIDGENFSIVHADTVNVEAVADAIEDKAVASHEEGKNVHSRISTLDSDGAGMNQNQVAKAVIYIMKKFCDKKGVIHNESLSDVLSSMMSNTTENVAFLRKVSKTGHFDLLFMPICDLRKGTVHHFESLIRFNPQKLDESPYPLIELAEEIGVINDLDFAVCHKAMQLIKKISAKETLPPVAINISGSSVASPDFMGRLRTLLEKECEDPEQVMFEITESSAIEDVEQVNTAISQIRGLGYKFCLDDFGSGAASFNYLSQLDVDIVKFDGPIVRRACATDKGNDVLKGMVKMCEEMDIVTVAERVRSQKDANQLFYLGVTFGQGKYYGMPALDPLVYADKFPTRLVRHKS